MEAAGGSWNKKQADLFTPARRQRRRERGEGEEEEEEEEEEERKRRMTRRIPREEV